MLKSTTPLFDKLNEIIDFIWYRVVPLFKPEEFQAEDEKHMSTKDWFIYKFIESRSEGAGMIPPYEGTRFYRIAKLGEELPNPELLRRELLQAYLACSFEHQSELLRSEIYKALCDIRDITNIIIYDFKPLKRQWLDQIQNAIETAHNESAIKRFIKRTGKSECDILAYRDYHWPDAIKYLECLYELVERIFVYVINLREFSYWESPSKEEFHIVPVSNLNDQVSIGDGSVPFVIKKPKRVNAVAENLHKCVTDKYSSYIIKGYNHKSAISALVHDFRLEYSIRNPANRKKQISAIVRKWKE